MTDSTGSLLDEWSMTADVFGTTDGLVDARLDG